MSAKDNPGAIGLFLLRVLVFCMLAHALYQRYNMQENSVRKCLKETDLCFMLCLVVYLNYVMFPTVLKPRLIHKFTQGSVRCIWSPVSTTSWRKTLLETFVPDLHQPDFHHQRWMFDGIFSTTEVSLTEHWIVWSDVFVQLYCGPYSM